MQEVKKILKAIDLNFGNELKNFDFEIEASKYSINSIICFDNSASSLLKILGNVEENFKGEVIFNEDSNAIYIPKTPSSFPWLNVVENINYVINNSNYSVKASNNQVQNIIDDVGLKGYEKHFPDNKSIGFRFRISLASILTLKPKLILIDNSFSQMDNETKFEIYDLLKDISGKYKTSVLFSTTNINEAIYLSENIYLMKTSNSKIIDRINLKEEWQKLGVEETRNRQIIIKEKIIHSFLKHDINNIL